MKAQEQKITKAQAACRAWKENVHVLNMGLELVSNLLASAEYG